MGLFDLEKHLAFYGAYHSNHINVVLHMIFVWPIFFTFLLLFHFLPFLQTLAFSPPFCSSLNLNFGFCFALAYSIFYICLDAKAGSLAAFICLVLWFGADSLAIYLGFSLALKVVLIVQIICWVGQFIGHGFFEKRAPALLDNLVQAFVMAPFFVLLEALEMWVKYEPYPGFRTRVDAEIRKEIKAWKDKKAA